MSYAPFEKQEGSGLHDQRLPSTQEDGTPTASDTLATHIAAQQNASAASQGKKAPLQGVWATGGGKALADMVRETSGNTPIHIPLPNKPQEKQRVPIHILLDAANTQLQQLQGASLPRRSSTHLTQPAHIQHAQPISEEGYNYFGYYGRYNEQSNEWHNMSMISTDNTSIATGSSTPHIPTLTATHDPARESCPDQPHGIPDGSIYPLTTQDLDESVVVLLTYQDHLLMLSKRPVQCDESSSSSAGGPHEEGEAPRVDSGECSSELLNHILARQWYVPFYRRKPIRPASDAAAGEASSTTVYSSQRPTPSDLALLALENVLHPEDQSHLHVSKVFAIEDYTSLHSGRRVRYAVHVQYGPSDSRTSPESAPLPRLQALIDPSSNEIIAPEDPRAIHDIQLTAWIPLNQLNFSTKLQLYSTDIINMAEMYPKTVQSLGSKCQSDSSLMHCPPVTHFSLSAQQKYPNYSISTRFNSIKPTTIGTRQLHLPFSILESLLISTPLPGHSTSSHPLLSSVLLVKRRGKPLGRTQYQWGFPISHVDRSESFSFTATRLNHSLFGLLIDEWSLLDMDGHYGSTMNPSLGHGIHLSLTSHTVGNPTRTCSHTPCGPMNRDDIYWPPRSRPTAKVDYLWADMSILHRLAQCGALRPDVLPLVEPLLAISDQIGANITPFVDTDDHHPGSDTPSLTHDPSVSDLAPTSPEQDRHNLEHDTVKHNEAPHPNSASQSADDTDKEDVLSRYYQSQLLSNYHDHLPFSLGALLSTDTFKNKAQQHQPS